MEQPIHGTQLLILIDVEQLATILHKSVSSIRSDNTRSPELLPPRLKIRGNKRLLWRLQEVETWLARHVDGADGETPVPRPPKIARPTKRGRPTKAEQVNRQRFSPSRSANTGHPEHP